MPHAHLLISSSSGEASLSDETWDLGACAQGSQLYRAVTWAQVWFVLCEIIMYQRPVRMQGLVSISKKVVAMLLAAITCDAVGSIECRSIVSVVSVNMHCLHGL